MNFIVIFKIHFIDKFLLDYFHLKNKENYESNTDFNHTSKKNPDKKKEVESNKDHNHKEELETPSYLASLSNVESEIEKMFRLFYKMIKMEPSENQFIQKAFCDIRNYLEENFKRYNIDITDDQIESDKITKSKKKNKNNRQIENDIQINNANDEVISENETQVNLLKKKRGRPSKKDNKSNKNQKSSSRQEEDIEITIKNKKENKIHNMNKKISLKPVENDLIKTPDKKDIRSESKSNQNSNIKHNYESPIKNSSNLRKSLEKVEKESLNSPFIDLNSPKQENSRSKSKSPLKTHVSSNTIEKEYSNVNQESASKLNVVTRRNQNKEDSYKSLVINESSNSILRSSSKKKIESRKFKSESKSNYSPDLINEKRKSLRSSEFSKSYSNSLESLESKSKLKNSPIKMPKFTEKENFHKSKPYKAGKSTKSNLAKSETENLNNMKEVKLTKSNKSSVEESLSPQRPLIKRTPTRSGNKNSEINTESKISNSKIQISNSKKIMNPKDNSENSNFDIKLDKEIKSKDSKGEKTTIKRKEKSPKITENNFSTPVKSLSKEYYKTSTTSISKSPSKLQTRSSGNSNQKINSTLTFKNASGNKSESYEKGDKVSEVKKKNSESPSKFVMTPTIKEKKLNRRDERSGTSSDKKFQILLQENVKQRSEKSNSSRSNKLKINDKLLGKKQFRIDLDKSNIKGKNRILIKSTI